MKSLILGLAAALSIQPVAAHSWVEQLMRISANGTMTGTPGYMRGYVSRAISGFSDDDDNYLLPPNGRSTGDAILATDSLCHPSQRTSNYSSTFPMLSVGAGDFVALRYQENGHVTLPDVNPTKPTNRGTVYVYGTTEPQTDELFQDVFQQWTADGTGGNGRGRLLATRNFDDGQCYQVNSGAISTLRQASFKKEAENPQGTDLWCQNDIQLPTDLAADTTYTLYWVWSWPTFNKAGSPTDIVTPGFNVTTLQYYTSCMDVQVTASSGSSKAASDAHNFASSFITSQDLNSAAVLEQLEAGAFQVSVPGSTGNTTSSSGTSNGASNTTSVATGAATATGTTLTSVSKTTAAGAAGTAGGETVFVTITQTEATATVTVTDAATTTTPATTKSGRKTKTVTTDSTVLVTETVQPSGSVSTAANAAGAAATAATTAGSGRTFSVQPFLTASAATTFKRVRR